MTLKTRVIRVALDDVDPLSAVVEGLADVEVVDDAVSGAAASLGLGRAVRSVRVEVPRAAFASLAAALVRESDSVLADLPAVITEKGKR